LGKEKEDGKETMKPRKKKKKPRGKRRLNL
jgi:hypothetical protein